MCWLMVLIVCWLIRNLFCGHRSSLNLHLRYRQCVLTTSIGSMLTHKKPVLWASQLPELAPQVAKKKGLFASMKSEIKATMTTITMSHTGKFS